MRLDEIDEMDLNVLESAQGQPMSTKKVKSQTVMSSTHQYPDGTVTNVLKRAQELGWPVHRWCWRETSNPKDGWLARDEVERKRAEIPKHMWEAEYELYEPSFDSRAIEPEVADWAFDLSMGYAEVDVNSEVIIELPRPDRDYITGVDWAKARDNTVVWTFDVTETPWKTVAYARMARRPWPEMIEHVNQRIAFYPGKLAHDATGIGSVVDDYLVVPETMRKGDIHPIIMAGRNRNDMVTNYISALENRFFKTPRLKHPYEEHKFASVDDLYNGSSKAHLPDSIAAAALAYSLKNNAAAVYALPMLNTRPVSPWEIR
jgi:phage FluMu gp28-like protein